MKKNVISIETLEAQSLGGTLVEGVLKMFSGSLVILKGIRHNNLYYLNGLQLQKIWRLQNIWMAILPGHDIQGCNMLIWILCKH